ncbi:MAG: cofactor assembly of complex C subunit B [Microcoleaceae cyanobacterium]
MMSLPVIPSTLILTVLLGVGLFFFIKASVKERIQQEQLQSEQTADELLTQLKQYLGSRSYRITALDPEKNLITFEGEVRASWFLAILLSALFAIGLLCLALVVSTATGLLSYWLLGVLLLSPLAGLFYWRGATRVEQVSCQLNSVENTTAQPCSVITVTAHRDELRLLKQALTLNSL